MATLYLMVGLPGAGKTTRARELAAERGAIWLSPDVWMIPLYGASDPDGKRDVLEGRLISVALQALRLRTSVVLDFGFWGRDERACLQALAASVGGEAQVVYLPVDPQTQLERISRRWSAVPHQTFAVTAAELDSWRAIFQPPQTDELAGHFPPDPPSGGDWLSWGAARWPSLDQVG
nr:ATP-binding protein [uncultured Friedmanniella sp.]